MIHSLSDVRSTKLGENTKVWQFTVILEGAIIGKNCNINANVFIENDVFIEDNVTIKSGVQLWDGITIKNNVFVGPNVTFTNDLKPRSKQYPSKFLKTTLKDHCSIGANATIIGGVTVGEYAMIGAGSVVTKNVGKHELWYGHPAKFHSYICQCGERCDNSFMCKKCKETKL